MSEQLSPHFKRSEFACHCGCGFDSVEFELVTALEAIRSAFKRPVVVVSGCRCAKHNRAVKGAPNSQHVLGKAADIVVVDSDPEDVARWCESHWKDTYGIGRYEGWTHIDVRMNKARWQG